MKRIAVGLVLGLISSYAVQAADGFIHGTVVTKAGKELTGAIRWGDNEDDEVFWSDHFNGNKRAPYDLSELDEDAREAILDAQPGPTVDFGSTTIEFVKLFGGGELRPRPFIVEFGSIAEVVPSGRERAQLKLRDGRSIDGDGGSNDFDVDVMVVQADGTKQTIDWDDVERVRFSAGDSGDLFGPHIFGTVRTSDGREFSGPVQWDHDERLLSEELDAESEDGDESSYEFGSIRSIQREGDSSRVVLRDGTELLLGGTNDVNESNRGIYVNDRRYGRVDIPWDAFDLLVIDDDLAGQLPGWPDYALPRPLRGSVTTRDGASHSGELVYDLDRQSRGEVIHGGDEHNIDFEVPLRLIERVIPGDDAATLALRGGESLTLHGAREVDDSNSGVLVLGEGDEPRWVPWAELRELKLSGD